MYMILWWKTSDYVTAITNKDGSIMLFDSIEEADDFANKHPKTIDLRVISIEGVYESNIN